MIVNAKYRCTMVAHDPQAYGQVTAEFERADGFAGYLVISGADVSKPTGPEVDKFYSIRIEEVP